MPNGLVIQPIRLIAAISLRGGRLSKLMALVASGRVWLEIGRPKSPGSVWFEHEVDQRARASRDPDLEVLPPARSST